jgi:hypothetical protein
MDTSAPVNDRDARLAGWASSALASSFVFGCLALLVIVGASDALTMLREHLVGTLCVAFILGCYIVSFICLHKIRHYAIGSRNLLWGASLVAACVPIAAVIYWLGIGPGLVICLLEVIAVTIHIFALADV